VTQQADALLATLPASIDIIRHGMLPAPAVSQLLQTARFALMDVTSETWSKSGAFMACAAHGCAAVVTATSSNPVPLSYTIAPNELDTISPAEVEARASALASWYEANADWPVIATRMAALLQTESPARVA
jgi:hypothetical protein